MKVKLLMLAMLLSGLFSKAQVGINCQYVPGVQIGSTTVKSDTWGKYRYGAGLATMMIDRVTEKWYMNLDMNSLYYTITQMNRGKYLKIAKNEGGLFAMRIGRMFGKSDDFRLGFSLNGGYSQSNIDSIRTVTIDGNNGVKSFWNYGLGIVAYKQVNDNLSAMAKIGYDKLKNKSTGMNGRDIYLETTVAYKLLHEFGLSAMPCFYFKKYEFNSRAGVVDHGKSTTFVLRIGLTKFF